MVFYVSDGIIGTTNLTVPDSSCQFCDSASTSEYSSLSSALYSSVTGFVPRSDLIKQMQLVLNSAARLVFSASRYDRITPLLTQLHWLKVPECIKLLAVLVYKCLHQTASPYLAESSADEARQRLRSASTSSLVVRHTRFSTIGDRAIPVAAARLWNTLPLNVTSASSISVFRKHLKTHLFCHSFPESPVVPVHLSFRTLIDLVIIIIITCTVWMGTVIWLLW